MVDMQTGGVVVVFQPYPGMKPLESCRKACNELGIDPACGHYRLDKLKQNSETGNFKWVRVYRFSLEVN
jgi:hypothetical protein